MEGKRLVEWIESGDQQWDWANSPKTVDPLKHLIAKIDEKTFGLQTNQRMILVGQLLVKDMDTEAKERLMNDLGKMVSAMEDLVNALAKHLEWLQKGNQTRASLNLD